MKFPVLLKTPDVVEQAGYPGDFDFFRGQVFMKRDVCRKISSPEGVVNFGLDCKTIVCVIIKK